ncbi:MAG: UDP-3-O-[3-hydroxymyristoyl] N-acetylglucosamine deacetylase [Candidatus Pelagibacter sp.]|nr:UDP-3-O-[3-hydroxymyristoyl] N-acetylglucosamine deacetylase [Candidatus Pelagibacter sp.]RPG11498.1 MAG: UDP-3-O-[3-hydroxymyristoyl] N-acetylglucosamine deacetylase [Pelagibacteraceae bacterium TMED170]|tara:strand:+ start:4014 stop:4940 length:927 start_codon:yes stop_codon:yes gene_type:complete
MFKLNQTTIQKPILFSGVGLHSGQIANVKLIPAIDNEGITFKRVDLKKNNIIKAIYNNVSSAKLCTTLKNSFGNEVSTVEHLMAAFYISGVDNITVEIDNNEVPIMDGSSKDFINLIENVGLKQLQTKRKYLKILKKVQLSQGKKFISIEPSSESFDVSFELSYDNKIIGNQKNHINFENKNLFNVYSSRTFCLFEDIEKIKKNGLAKGGSLENAVVVKGEEILNEGGLRNEKEFVNHKILDLAGDFLLSGYRILGSVKCVQGGHHLSNIFLRDLFSDKSNYTEIVVNNIGLLKKDLKTPVNKLAVNA